MSRNARIALVAAAVAVAVAAFVIVNPGGDDSDDKTTAATPTAAQTTTGRATTPAPPPQPQVPLVRTREGKPVGGVKTIKVNQGERLRFRVTSNVDEEIHVHGFDITREISPGKPVFFNLDASFTGRFEVEFHGSGEQIADLRVEP
jgi:FtsP/CotA-like multicopper oxidase with cupredoxin domain